MKNTGIRQKTILLLLTVLTLASLVFLALFWSGYRWHLQEERSEASRTVNHLLQASLENAMLKRDLPGLTAIVKNLAAQPDIQQVTILNLKGEIRFSGSQNAIGQTYKTTLDQLCDGCQGSFKSAETTTHFVTLESGSKVLRSVNPVKNQPVCVQCHGSLDSNAVNGILIVDYDAGPILRKARSSMQAMGLAGLCVLLLASAAVWRFMSRSVLQPISLLREGSDALADGNLQARVSITSQDEFASLGNSFNSMAARLDKTLADLREKEAYLQSLIDAIPDGIRVIDEDFRIVQANRAYCAQMGEDSAGALGKFCYQSSHGRESPCPPTLITCPVHEIRQQAKPIKTLQHFISSDEQTMAVQVFAAPLLDRSEQGERRLVVEAIRNLSQDIHFSHEQKLSSVGQLAAGVAHEILNPLSSIRLALNATLKKLDDTQEQGINEYLTLVDGEIDRCIEITNRLLNLSSLAGGNMELVDVHTAIQETVSLLHYEAMAKKINIETDFPETPIRMLATNQDIRMLVLNLVQNAFHAMPKGGVLKVATEETGDHFFVRICDTGVGVAPEDRKHIFDPFFSHRADGVTGVGLGLAICQSIVKRYQGDIGAIDTKPQGTCFEVRFNSLKE